jgi:hypothetical protein
LAFQAAIQARASATFGGTSALAAATTQRWRVRRVGRAAAARLAAGPRLEKALTLVACRKQQ